MHGGRKVICVILARGGSKGVPRKNVKPLRGRPLITYSIDAAKKAPVIDEVLVSTDDAEIKKVAEGAGATVIDRPAELAGDNAAYIDALHHLLRSAGVKPDTLVVSLENTFPIRAPGDIERCVELCDDSVDCVASVTEVKVNPALMFRLQGEVMVPYDASLTPKNRQEMETLYAYTGSILVGSARFFMGQKSVAYGGRIKGYVMDERSSIDIDTPLDFEICEHIMGMSGR